MTTTDNKISPELKAYRVILRNNKNKLSSIKSDYLATKYPSLSLFFNQSRGNQFRKLDQLLQYFLDFKDDKEGNQHVDYEKPIKMFVSHRYLVKHYKGSRPTWAKYINCYCALGLLIKYIPQTDPEKAHLNTPVMQKSIEIMHRKHEAEERAIEDFGFDVPIEDTNPITLYHVPTWTIEILKTANERAEFVMAHGNNPNKEAIRDAYGDTIANAVTGTFHDRQSYTNERREAFDEALQYFINTQGYAILDDVYERALYALWKSYDPFRHAPFWVKGEWKSYYHDLLNDNGLKRSRPSKAEIIKFNLPGLKHIIRYVST